jgi:hypothetical protein
MMLSPQDLRICVAVPRSGSTLFMRVMAQNPSIGVTSRLILMGKMPPRPADPSQPRHFEPDYSIFDASHPIYRQAHDMGKRLIVSKEEFGNDRRTGTAALNECNFPMFRTGAEIIATKPVFIFADPIRTFDNWLSKGWSDLSSFLLTYRTHLNTFKKVAAINADAVFYTHEYMVQTQETQTKVFRAICERWGVEFDPAMLEFKTKFGEEFLYANKKESLIYEVNPKGLFTTVQRSSGIRNDIPPKGLLTPAQTQVITDRLMPEYAAVHQAVERAFGPDVSRARGRQK